MTLTKDMEKKFSISTTTHHQSSSYLHTYPPQQRNGTMGNANLTAPPTLEQIKGFHWARSMSAIPSIFGSAFMIQHILRSRKRRRRTISRILLGMACHDFIYSICAVFGTLFNPQGALPAFVNPFARGTWATCETSAFFSQYSSTASVLYNGSLSLCYFLSLRYQWRDRDLKRIEPYLHAFPFVIGISMSSVAVANDLYNPAGADSRIQEYPPGCLGTGQCMRGDHADKYLLGLFYSWVWMVFVFLVVCMILIYLRIRKTEQRTLRRSIFRAAGSESLSGSPSDRNEGGRQTLASRYANQALFYALVYLLTWIWGTVHLMVHESGFAASRTFLPIIYLLLIFEPLQGFNNMLVYFRPRYLAYLRKRDARNFISSSQLSGSGELMRGGGSGSFLRRNRLFAALRFTFSVQDLEQEDPDDEKSNTMKNSSQGQSRNPEADIPHEEDEDEDEDVNGLEQTSP